MHLICESRLYTESLVYFACQVLFVYQSIRLQAQKMHFVLQGIVGFWKAELDPPQYIISNRLPIIMTNEPQIQQIYRLKTFFFLPVTSSTFLMKRRKHFRHVRTQSASCDFENIKKYSKRKLINHLKKMQQHFLHSK